MLEIECSNLASLTGLPFSLWSDEKPFFSSFNDALYLLLKCEPVRKIVHETEEYRLFVSEGFLQFGIIRYQKDKVLIIGPCLSQYPVKDEVIRTISEVTGLKDDHFLKDIYNCLVNKRKYDYESFRLLLESVYIALFDREPAFAEQTAVPQNHDALPSHNDISKDSIGLYESINLNYVRDVERLIENGNLEELKFIIRNNIPAPRPHHSTKAIQDERYSFAILSHIAAEAAVKGGIPFPLAQETTAKYMKMIDQIDSYAELQNLSFSMQEELCGLVREHSSFRSDNPIVQRAIDYIEFNYRNDLSSRELADEAGLSPSYFCTLFRTTTGLRVTDYIHKVKINNSLSLLKFGNMTVEEIAEYLSFSSTSYFERIFKRIMNCTPTSYQRQKRI